ncbi:MAG: hypothetical protein D4R67_08425 [Bacteroidetes bacterium]|nr:MAG: hypothetical protein D4R67_08425 [Bacteroidota bacterium]
MSLLDKITRPTLLLDEQKCRDVALAEQLIHASGKGIKLAFQGFLSHFGESYQAHGPDQIRSVYEHGVGALTELKNTLPGSHPGFISVGDTPTCSVLDELQPLN